MNEVRLLLADKNLSYLEIARKMLRFHDEAYQVDVASYLWGRVSSKTQQKPL